jgi:hypothetical protein
LDISFDLVSEGEILDINVCLLFCKVGAIVEMVVFEIDMTLFARGELDLNQATTASSDRGLNHHQSKSQRKFISFKDS